MQSMQHLSTILGLISLVGSFLSDYYDPHCLVVVFAPAWFCKTLTHIPYGAEHLAAVRQNLFFVLSFFFKSRMSMGLWTDLFCPSDYPRSTSCLMFIYMVYKAVVVVQCFTRGAHKIAILSQAAVTVNSICICVCLCVCVPPQYYTYMCIYISVEALYTVKSC